MTPKRLALHSPATVSTPQPPESASALPFPVVGIGASAGGLAAFESFFSGLPHHVDPGMAFVLVQHLAPDHESILADLIRRYTHLKVFEVTDGVVVQINCVYIIPPNNDMAFLNGSLQLLAPAAMRGHRLPVDFLFRSLAQDQHERGIGIVLSGSGSDGTLGVRAIKSEGGMVMAQTPASTEFDGMPRNALATGLVDFELPPAEMMGQLIAYTAHFAGRTAGNGLAPEAPSVNSLQKLFILVRSQTGHDFSQYKASTINRRIERRMAVHQIAKLEDYVRFLRQTPVEVEALFRDFLIGVTHFFRDPEVFKALEDEVIHKLFDNKPPGTPLRAWSAGCSTGEEAYSIAILLQEHMESIKSSFKLQVFATDIDNHAVSVARSGMYPAGIAVDVTPERLARFFTLDADSGSYKVNKNIRDLLVFSEQDVIKDPPFSKLDLIVCRNLLIYMNADLQKKLIALFHYALNPGGILCLGSSETIGDFGSLFSVIDRKAKVYLRNEDFQGARRPAYDRFIPVPSSRESGPSMTSAKTHTSAKPSLRDITEQALLQETGMVGALVNSAGDIHYLHGRSGMFLEPAVGESSVNNILAMARDGLKSELTVALHKAALPRQRVVSLGLNVKTNGHYTKVNLRVSPVTPAYDGAPDSSLFLVVLESALGGAEPQALPPVLAGPRDEDGYAAHAAARIVELQAEIRTKDGYLHAAREELVTSNEELKSSNEEMQSINEELQSTNEELETSKEELQSINEELATVNSELQTKVNDLSHANNDMNNLLAGTGIGTIFLDSQLRILRFTPAATQIFSLIASDVGRPIKHFVSRLSGYDRLQEDAQEVLKTLIPKELSAKAEDGRVYTLRILPYRTQDNVIEGAVVTFVDVSEMAQARDELKQANQLARLAVVVRDATDAITVQNLDGKITAWNPGATRMYGWTEAEALGMYTRDRIPKALQQEALAKLHQLSRAQILEPYQTQRIAKGGTVWAVSLTSTALLNEAGHLYAIATTERLARPALEPTPESHNGKEVT